MIHENTPVACLLEVLNAYDLRGKSRSDAGQMLIEAACGMISIFTAKGRGLCGGHLPSRPRASQVPGRGLLGHAWPCTRGAVMITHADASGPVTGEPGDPAHGGCRVAQYRDAGTGALMYRVEKESSEPDPAAELVAIHVSARYCLDLLAYMWQELGGDLKAGGAMLLIRPTRYNPEGSPDWSGNAAPEADTCRVGDPITPPEEAITPPGSSPEDTTGELF